MLRVLLALLVASSAQAGEPPARHVHADQAPGGSAAVIVDEAVALVHTAQIFPDAEKDDPASQIESVLDKLGATLDAAGSGLDQRLVKLHVVIERADLAPAIREAFAKRAPGRGPAWTVVVGKPAKPGALLAIDAVAMTEAKPKPGQVDRSEGFATLPAGPRVFISGQAEPDADLAAATRKTLESLDATLKHLGMGQEHIVQLKAFYQPPESAEIVERETARFFGDETAPPLVLVEWKSPASLPIEIELVASSSTPAAEGAEVIEYLTPPGLSPSPVFSRIARVNRGPLIFVSGLVGAPETTGAEQVEAIFARLKNLLKAGGSDFRHMAKATYYVADDDSSKALNELRPNHYDPARPPAASKAAVPGVGAPGRSIAVDMIAVGAP